jgi:threonine 3-dehydrogenase
MYLSCSDPLGNAVHTALAFDLSAKVSSSQRRPDRLLTCRSRMAGAHEVVLRHQSLPARSGPARLAVDVRERNLHESCASSTCTKGFDSRRLKCPAAEAFTDMLDVMVNSDRIAMLGIMPGSAAID